MKSKIAICVSGLRKDTIYDGAKQLIIENIINNNDVDICQFFEYSEDDHIHDYEKYMQFSGGPTGVRINTILPMFYKIFKCNELKKEYERENGIKFDIVVRTRFDLYILNKINFKDINFKKVNFINCGCFMLNNEIAGICDFFAISNSDNLDVYSNCFNNLNDLFFDNSIPYKNPEILQISNLKKSNIEIDRIAIDHYILRTNGQKTIIRTSV